MMKYLFTHTTAKFTDITQLYWSFRKFYSRKILSLSLIYVSDLWTITGAHICDARPACFARGKAVVDVVIITVVFSHASPRAIYYTALGSSNDLTLFRAFFSFSLALSLSSLSLLLVITHVGHVYIYIYQSSPRVMIIMIKIVVTTTGMIVIDVSPSYNVSPERIKKRNARSSEGN